MINTSLKAHKNKDRKLETLTHFWHEITKARPFFENYVKINITEAGCEVVNWTGLA
jgi:hypothetical protein